MTSDEYDRLVAQFTESRRAVHANRRARYAADDDVLANITRTATETVSPLQVWMVYAAKHWDSIRGLVDAISRGENPEPLIGEPDIAGSFRDLANYIELGYALLMDAQGAERDLRSLSADVNDAALSRLSEAYAFLNEESDGHNLAAPFCGCEQCVVREVLDAAVKAGLRGP